MTDEHEIEGGPLGGVNTYSQIALLKEWEALSEAERRALLLKAYESTGVRVPEDLRDA